MANYDRPYTAMPEEAPAQSRKWPLFGVMIIDLVLIAIVVFASMLVLSVVFVGVRAAQQGIDLQRDLTQAQLLRLLGSDGAFVILLVQNAIFAAVPILRVAVIRREPLAEIGFQAPRPLKLLSFGVGLGALALIVNVLFSILFELAGIRQNQAEQYPLFRGDYLGQGLFLIGAALLAPLGEEVLFRGYVFNAIRQTFQERRWAVPAAYIFSAVLFMGAHSLSATQGLLGLLIPAFLVGLLLAWGMHRTGSLIPSLIAHMMNNGFAIVGLLACINDPSITGCPQL